MLEFVACVGPCLRVVVFSLSFVAFVFVCCFLDILPESPETALWLTSCFGRIGNIIVEDLV